MESERPSDSTAIVAVLVIDLVPIALVWLIAWGCSPLAVGCVAGLQRTKNSGQGPRFGLQPITKDPRALLAILRPRSGKQ